MLEKEAERHHQIVRIKEGARTANDGRSYLLQGLWACRLAAGLTQRQVAELIGSTQGTVRKLERQARGAHVSTIRKLCTALRVTPEDLLCGNSDKQ